MRTNRRQRSNHCRQRTVTLLIASAGAATALALVGSVAFIRMSEAARSSRPPAADSPTTPSHVARQLTVGHSLPARAQSPSKHRAETQVVAPERLSIPSLGVSAPVTQHVVVQRKGPERGLLTAPSDFHDLGWYRHAGIGALVIDGHVGFAAGAGPLAYIGSMARGASIDVLFNNNWVAYRVTSIERVPKGSLSPKFFTAAYDGELMLITCDYQSPLVAGHFVDNVLALAKPARAATATSTANEVPAGR